MAVYFNGDFSYRVEISEDPPTFALYGFVADDEIERVYYTEGDEAIMDIEEFGAYGFEYVHSTLGFGAENSTAQTT